MKKSSVPQLIIIILCLIGWFVASAQTDYIVLTKGDTLYGKVSHLNYNIKDQKVQLVDNQKKKTIYPMLQVKSFFMDNKMYHLVKTADHYKYMRPLKTGYLSLYAFQIDNQNSWDGRFLYKIDGRGVEVPNISFKKRINEMIQDCNGVPELIEEKKLGRNELDEIIDIYNNCIHNSTEIKSSPLPLSTTKEKLLTWNALEKAVGESAEFNEKESVLEMITEIKLKLERNESVPNFMVNSLKKSLEHQDHLRKVLDEALKTLS